MSLAGADMLHEPALSFTLPSIHDNSTTIECRVYHPHSLSASPKAPPWRKQAAIIAHPYAPLGGCYDDPVVQTVAVTLLKQGFVVGTFNFRGAGNSTGRTSWTSKPERSDYISFAGFIYYYIHYLDPFQLRNPTSPLASLPSSPVVQESTPALPILNSEQVKPLLLLAGYSYGAMVINLLPPLDFIVQPFMTPKTASAAADIRLRAQHLAEQQNVVLGSARAAHIESNRGRALARKSLGVRVGGDEDKRRSQEHSRRSFSIDAEEKIRKGVVDLVSRAKSHHIHHHKTKGHVKEDGDGTTATVANEGTGEALDHLPAVTDLMRPRIAYLLISPPVGWATNLMTFNLTAPVAGLFRKKSSIPQKSKEGVALPIPMDGKDTHHEKQLAAQKLVEHATLAVYGDSDVFVAVKKFRQWASRLQSIPNSKFRAHEVSTAGHFYIEEGVVYRLMDAVTAFTEELLR